ncbi:GlxA family transcriptional regulator [Methylococcus mesophilus]|uniref:GlxA family transcriptional regulator n=1 Tax=Methylococcus mesophilus TaxID=2993564 RepID=UPI00224B5DC6|nr:GlxA family transcriptional regulator [Methylococcus mesophilus]UZR28456.1 GlxA family transcriptional regulator [Methylococcus mesophilus]
MAAAPKFPSMETPKTIAMLAYQGAEMLDVVGPLDVFAAANALFRNFGLPEPYQIYILANQAGMFSTSSGMKLFADAGWQDWHMDTDTLFIAGTQNYQEINHSLPAIQWIKSMASRVRRLASVCTGAFLLAEAGLLDGRRATTHWLACNLFAKRYPEVNLQVDAIFIKEGFIYSSAGVTAGMDLALALVEEDLGREVSLEIARLLVVFLKRPGGQTQFSAKLRAQSVTHSRLKPMLEWLFDNLDKPVTVADMATEAAMSARNFSRLFMKETGLTPAKFLEKTRLEAAIVVMDQKNLPIKSIAKRCGFSNIDHFRRAFQRQYGVSPQDFRDRFC